MTQSGIHWWRKSLWLGIRGNKFTKSSLLICFLHLHPDSLPALKFYENKLCLKYMPLTQIFKGKMVRVEKILQCQDFIVLCLSLIYDSFTDLWCYFKAVYLVLGLCCRWYDVLGRHSPMFMAGSEALPVEPFSLWGLGRPYSLSLLPDLWGRERTGTAVSWLLGWLSEGTCLYCSVWHMASRRVHSIIIFIPEFLCHHMRGSELFEMYFLIVDLPRI